MKKRYVILMNGEIAGTAEDKESAMAGACACAKLHKTIVDVYEEIACFWGQNLDGTLPAVGSDA